MVSSEEVRAEKFLQTGKVDKSLAIYENMKSPTPRALNTLANIYAGKKGDYSTAIKHYKQALQIQEKVDESSVRMKRLDGFFCIEWRGSNWNTDPIGYCPL